MSEERITHVLKTWPDVFEAVWKGRKTAEYRRDDRGFQVNDELCLIEYDPAGEYQPGRGFSGREIEAKITHIVPGPDFGIANGYAMLSIRVFRKSDHGGVVWELKSGETGATT